MPYGLDRRDIFMPSLEIYVVYSNATGEMYITKSKRNAERITAAINKANKYLNRDEKFTCHLAKDFYRSHPIDKNNIKFTWEADSSERMDCIRYFYKIKGSHFVNTI